MSHRAPWIQFPGKRGRKRATCSLPCISTGRRVVQEPGTDPHERMQAFGASAAPGASLSSRSIAPIPSFALTALMTAPAWPVCQRDALALQH